MDLFRSRPPEAARVAEIKAWVVERFGLSGAETVMVTELRCSEPGCPPLETVIAVLASGSGNRQFKLHKSVAELTRADVAGL